jgi:hypothetical protein
VEEQSNDSNPWSVTLFSLRLDCDNLLFLNQICDCFVEYRNCCFSPLKVMLSYPALFVCNNNSIHDYYKTMHAMLYLCATMKYIYLFLQSPLWPPKYCQIVLSPFQQIVHCMHIQTNRYIVIKYFYFQGKLMSLGYA